MSAVYSSASRLLQQYLDREGGLKTLLFAQQLEADSNPSHAKQYKLVAETLRYKDVLDEVIDACRLHRLDRGLSRPLLLLLLFDLLFGQRRIEGGGHYKRLVMQHRTPIQSALARIYIARQASSPVELLPAALRPRPAQPRYVRVNTLRGSVQCAVEALQADGWAEVERPQRHPTAAEPFVFPTPRSFYRDADIDDLLVFPPSSTFHASALYAAGWLVLQDKASCMPAACLSPGPDDVVVDGCAAPGNKTSHLVAIVARKAAERSSPSRPVAVASVDAFEVHQQRFTLLTRLLGQKGIEAAVSCPAGCHPPHSAVRASGVAVTAHHASFLSLRGDEGLGRRATAVLLDPTCSGSGMTHTLDAYYKDSRRQAEQRRSADEQTRDRDARAPKPGERQAGKRRRTERGSGPAERTASAAAVERPDADEDGGEQQSGGPGESLSALSAFQSSLLSHAFSLPSVRRIVYSTCSHHVAENEAVVAASLAHSGRARGWEVQAGLLPLWPRRGTRTAVAGLTDAECERMVRCDANEDCTNGFFVCGFVRRQSAEGSDVESTLCTQTELVAMSNVRDDGEATGAVHEACERATALQPNSTTEMKKKKRKRKKRKVAALQAP